MVGSVVALDDFLRKWFQTEPSKEIPSTLLKKKKGGVGEVGVEKKKKQPTQKPAKSQPPHADFNKRAGMKRWRAAV